MNPDNIQTIHELSPMQQAMLFHSLMAPGSGVYVLQMSLRLTGGIDLPAFERAWRHLVARHSILRTAFFWEDLETPRQVVFREVGLEIEHSSWRGPRRGGATGAAGRLSRGGSGAWVRAHARRRSCAWRSSSWRRTSTNLSGPSTTW